VLPTTFVRQPLYAITCVRLTRWASFRMPSDETLRISLVSMLPLLRFSPSLVAVTPKALDLVFQRCPALKKLAAPPPHFDVPGPAHAVRTSGTSLPRYDLTRPSRSCGLVSTTPRWVPFRVGAILKSDRNLWSLCLKALTSRRHFPSSAALAALAPHPKMGCALRLALPHINPFTGDLSKVTFESIL